MAGHDGRWERVSGSALTRAMPPRTLAEASGGDCPLAFVIAVGDSAGAPGWTVRWSSRDDARATHPTAEAAMEAADRLIVKLARVAASSLAAQAGLDPAEWAFSVSDPVGGGIAFRHRRDPALCIRRTADGDGYRIMRGSIPARMRFPDAASAARVLAGASFDASTADRTVTAPRGHAAPSIAEVDPDVIAMGNEPVPYTAVVEEIAPVAADDPVLGRYVGDAADPFTHVAAFSLAHRHDGVQHRVPLPAGEAERLSVGDGIGIHFGEREGDGFRPVKRILVPSPMHAPSP